MLTRSVTITDQLADRTVESVLSSVFFMSDGWISRLKRREGGIRVNGERAYTTRRVVRGDVVRALAGDPADTQKAVPMPISLDVVYEDEWMLILDKPAGITVHADSRRPDEPTLDNALSAYLREDEFAHPVSRLDRGTTGLITYAKSGYVHALLMKHLHTDTFFREYRGISLGVPNPQSGSVDFPIGFAPGSTYQRLAETEGVSAVRAVSARTEYETLGVYGRYALLKLIPCTGRTHQLRVHMAAVGCPLAGDWLYGREDEAAREIVRPALHSYRIDMAHPITGERLSITSPLPADMRRLLGGCAQSD